MAEEDTSLSGSIESFFSRCGLDQQAWLDCHDFLERHFPGKTTAPAHTQGYCSYTLLVDNQVIQFRPPQYKLDINITTAAKDVYENYAPTTAYFGTLNPHGLLVYTMEKMEGISYKDFTNIEHPDKSKVRQTLCANFALFLAKAWRHQEKVKLPAGIIGSSIETRLEKLATELPLRFRPAASYTISQLDLINILPKTLAHGDIVASNILLDPATGNLIGLVDWTEAEILPFGICLYGLEEILGRMIDDTFVYYADAEQARDVFWTKLQQEISELANERTLQALKLARIVGILLWYGYAFDDGAIDRVVQEGRDCQEIGYLDAFLLKEPLW